jgi:uncharacterized protein YndB with AHSA1/START domain
MSIKIAITVKTLINAPIEKVWKYWTEPNHIKKWNHASDTWHTTHAENDLRKNGKFIYRMEAKDGTEGFDFSGFYEEIDENKQISYVLDDNRKVSTIFNKVNHNKTEIIQTFEAEDINTVEKQHEGWQSILDNFKAYVELN